MPDYLGDAQRKVNKDADDDDKITGEKNVELGTNQLCAV